MSLLSLNAMLALGQPAQPGQSGPPPWANLVVILPMLVIMYIILIRAPQKKAKEHAQLLKTVRRGDEVLTTGGIVGEVVTVKEKTIVLRSADAKFEVTKSAVTEISRRSGESNQS